MFSITEHEPQIMAFMLYSKHREFLPNEKPVCSSKPFELMREMVKEGMQSGEVRQMDLMVASTCLFGGPIRMITSHLDQLLENPLSSYINEVWGCSWKAISV
jgi:TetR/AcrR family transcriptional regulator, repressor of fatR-cypB operon